MQHDDAKQANHVQVPDLEDKSLTQKEAEEIIGRLGCASKMPWYSWGIPASECKTGSKLAQKPGSVCHACYALKGRYNYSNVQKAMYRRLRAFDDPRFVGAFIRALRLKFQRSKQYRADGSKENRFRIFDSGDLQSYEMLVKWVIIAQQLPEIEFYMPTKEYFFVRRYFTEHGAFPKNLHVKVSHPMIRQSYYGKTPGGADYTTVGVSDDPHTYDCPAHQQENKCKECDACWKPGNINYTLH